MKVPGDPQDDPRDYYQRGTGVIPTRSQLLMAAAIMAAQQREAAGDKGDINIPTREEQPDLPADHPDFQKQLDAYFTKKSIKGASDEVNYRRRAPMGYGGPEE